MASTQDTSQCASFYDTIAPYYTIIYKDWNTSVANQGKKLHECIAKFLDVSNSSDIVVRDVAAGIGTQALGLASLGYTVVASDLSQGALNRLDELARDRQMTNIKTTSACDMREFTKTQVSNTTTTTSSNNTTMGGGEAILPFSRVPDVVIALDNAIPHLLSDAEILEACKELYAGVRPGGLCLISTRDYDEELKQIDRSVPTVKDYGSREADGSRYHVSQVWKWRNGELPIYDLTMTFKEQVLSSGETSTISSDATYYAIGVDKLCEILQSAGFTDVQRAPRTAFFQPLISARRPE